MPRVLIFAPCERAIVSNEGPLSLVSILEKLITTAPQAPTAEHATVPMRWFVVSVWIHEASDDGKTFEQMVRLIGRDGTTAMHTEPAQFTTSAEKTRFRFIGRMDQFPITDGNLKLVLLYREVGAPDWIEAAEYPIDVELKTST